MQQEQAQNLAVEKNDDMTHADKVAALKAFFNIAEKWRLSNQEMIILLGRPSEPTFFNWKKGKIKTAPYDTVCRVSYILGIFKALQYLYTNPQDADEWIKKPNRRFGDDSALDRMLGGDITDLAAVRYYLDSVRGGH